MKILIAFLIFSAGCMAQTRIPTEEEAARFFERQDKTGFVLQAYSEEDELFGFYSKRQVGDVIVSGTKIYKVIDNRMMKIQNYGVIQLPGSLTEEQAVEQEMAIHKKYKSGVSFGDLIMEYGENKHRSNSAVEMPLDNLSEMHREMFDKYAVNEIFAINDADNTSYHIYLKNNNPVQKKVIRVFEAEYTD